MRIYYYTGTGNSLRTTRQLAARLGGAEPISMKAAPDPLIPESCHRLGLVFPICMSGLIGTVQEFARRLKPLEEQPSGQTNRPNVKA